MGCFGCSRSTSCSSSGWYVVTKCNPWANCCKESFASRRPSFRSTFSKSKRRSSSTASLRDVSASEGADATETSPRGCASDASGTSPWSSISGSGNSERPSAASFQLASLRRMLQTLATCLRRGRLHLAKSARNVRILDFWSSSCSVADCVLEPRTTPFRKISKASLAESSLYRTTFKMAVWPSTISCLVSSAVSLSNMLPLMPAASSYSSRD
mmetsp:Transcript_54624/g.112811  ORF Transcript_54624/g.112811 Transcript_54624/m.112811 type:complete len:213 (-) Transcript_54624:18-656(-)